MSQSNLTSYFTPGKILSMLKVLVLALILSVGASYVFAQAPAANPPTCPLNIGACNGPIHGGTQPQSKTGAFTAGNLFSNGDAFINGRLGVSIPAGTLPTANLDVAGTFRFRGNPIGGNTPTAGKVLTSDASGNATWQTPTAAGGGLITKVGELIVPKSCITVSSNACVKTVVFKEPFPTGTVPIVVAQPRWTDNIGDSYSTWRINEVTNSSFKFVMVFPNSPNSFGENNVMWAAYANPSVTAQSICVPAYSRVLIDGTQKLKITWKVQVSPDSILPVVTYTDTNPGPDIYDLPLSTVNNITYVSPNPEYYTQPSPYTVTKYFKVKDTRFNPSGTVLGCTVTG